MVLEPERHLQRVPQQQDDGHGQPGEAADQRKSGEELHHHEPAGKELLPDETVLGAVERVAAVEELVELVVRVAELVEAELPEAHVAEGRHGVLPGDQPVRGGEGHHQEEAARERAQAPVKQGSWIFF